MVRTARNIFSENLQLDEPKGDVLYSCNLDINYNIDDNLITQWSSMICSDNICDNVISTDSDIHDDLTVSALEQQVYDNLVSNLNFNDMTSSNNGLLLGENLRSKSFDIYCHNMSGM